MDYDLEKLDFLTKLVNTRTRRLRMFLKLKAPAYVVDQEKKLVTEAVAQLKAVLGNEPDVTPVTKGNIDSDSIFLDDPCTCKVDGDICPSCKRMAQREHGDEIPF